MGTFRIVNGQKQGGNVASYFCRGDGSVLHGVAGPVDADTLLREAKWVIETRKLAMSDSRGDERKYITMFRKAHIERLQAEHNISMDYRKLPANQTPDWYATYLFQMNGHRGGNANNQAKVHMLLGAFALRKLDEIYKPVFEKILNEKVSTLPVAEVGGKTAR